MSMTSQWSQLASLSLSVTCILDLEQDVRHSFIGLELLDIFADSVAYLLRVGTSTVLAQDTYNTQKNGMI